MKITFNTILRKSKSKLNNTNCIYFVTMMMMIMIIVIIIVIYHDFLPPPRRGSHVKSVNTHTQSSNTPLIPYTLHLCLDFQLLSPFYILSQQHHVMAPSPFQVITTRAWQGGLKEHRAKQKWPRETIQLHIYGLSDLSLILTQHPPSFLYCPRPPSHHPSILTSVSLVPALYLHPSTTAFWPYSTHPFSPHAQTISILSDPLYSLTTSLFQL